MNMEVPNNFEEVKPLPEVPDEVFQAAEAEKNLQEAIDKDDTVKGESALKAMESLQKSKQEIQEAKEKLPEELLNAMKEATAGPKKEKVNWKKINPDSILDKPFGQESTEGFEKVAVNGKEIMLSRKTSNPITYAEAQAWCAKDGGRLPTIEELEALYKSDKAGSFEGKIIWSSSMKFNSPQVFDFGDGKIKLRNKEDEINATRAVSDIN
jgi:hypothetical protein